MVPQLRDAFMLKTPNKGRKLREQHCCLMLRYTLQRKHSSQVCSVECKRICPDSMFHKIRRKHAKTNDENTSTTSFPPKNRSNFKAHEPRQVDDTLHRFRPCEGQLTERTQRLKTRDQRPELGKNRTNSEAL